MKQKVLLWIVFVVLVACRPVPAPGWFALYLLSQEVPAVSMPALAELPLQKQPLFTSGDIVAYHWDTHEIELTLAAYRRIQAVFPTPVKVSGIPFVVCVGDQRIYAGAFWTPISSLSYDGVVIMQPFGELAAGQAPMIQVTRGYPSSDFSSGPDPRSDIRIKTTLQAAGKLK
jgi:hypothetical protein